MNIDVTNQPAISRGAEIMNAALEHCGHTEVLRILKEQIAVCARNQHKPVTEKIKINRSGDTVLDPVVSAQKIKINPFGESLNELAGMAISLASHLYQGAYQRTSSTAALTESEQTTEKE